MLWSLLLHFGLTKFKSVKKLCNLNYSLLLSLQEYSGSWRKWKQWFYCTFSRQKMIPQIFFSWPLLTKKSEICTVAQCQFGCGILKMVGNTVMSRFKKDLKLEIHLHKTFFSGKRFLDSLHKSFLNQDFTVPYFRE